MGLLEGQGGTKVGDDLVHLVVEHCSKLAKPGRWSEVDEIVRSEKVNSKEVYHHWPPVVITRTLPLL